MLRVAGALAPILFAFVVAICGGGDDYVDERHAASTEPTIHRRVQDANIFILRLHKRPQRVGIKLPLALAHWHLTSNPPSQSPP
jgi:hypothetical protein